MSIFYLRNACFFGFEMEREINSNSSSSSSSSKDAGGDGTASMRYVTHSGRPVVQVAFYSPEKQNMLQDDRGYCNVMNSLAACWTSDGTNYFSHCEIRFSNNKACSVTSKRVINWKTGEKIGGYVHYKPRSFASNYNMFIEFSVSQKQESLMIKRAKEYEKMRIPFNEAGMKLNFVAPFKWWPINRERRSFFCSELIVTLLQDIGMLKNLKPHATSPNNLFNELKQLQKSCEGFNWGRHDVSDHTKLNMIPLPYASSERGNAFSLL